MGWIKNWTKPTRKQSLKLLKRKTNYNFGSNFINKIHMGFWVFNVDLFGFIRNEQGLLDQHLNNDVK